MFKKICTCVVSEPEAHELSPFCLICTCKCTITIMWDLLFKDIFPTKIMLKNHFAHYWKIWALRKNHKNCAIVLVKNIFSQHTDHTEVLKNIPRFSIASTLTEESMLKTSFIDQLSLACSSTRSQKGRYSPSTLQNATLMRHGMYNT